MITNALILLVALTIFVCLAIRERRKTVGKLYWHIHHDQLLEMATEPIAGRKMCIRRYKPLDEVETRLRCLKPVKGTLPSGVVEAFRSSARANKRLYGVWANGLLSLQKLGDERARAEIRLRVTLQKYESEINRLHDAECRCSWNGTTLFPGG